MLLQLDPTRKAKERRIAELEASLAAPPAGDETAAAIRYQVALLFCGFSAFQHDGERQDGIEEAMANAVRDVPLWAIERAVVAQHRASPPSKYPPSASTFHHACQVEIAARRTEIIQLRRGSVEADRPAATVGVNAAARANMHRLFADLGAELRKTSAERGLATVRPVRSPVIVAPIDAEGAPSPATPLEREPIPVPEPMSAGAETSAADHAPPHVCSAPRTGTEG